MAPASPTMWRISPALIPAVLAASSSALSRSACPALASAAATARSPFWARLLSLRPSRLPLLPPLLRAGPASSSSRKAAVNIAARVLMSGGVMLIWCVKTLWSLAGRALAFSQLATKRIGWPRAASDPSGGLSSCVRSRTSIARSWLSPCWCAWACSATAFRRRRWITAGRHWTASRSFALRFLAVWRSDGASSSNMLQLTKWRPRWRATEATSTCFSERRLPETRTRQRAAAAASQLPLRLRPARKGRNRRVRARWCGATAAGSPSPLGPRCR
mmetsp:Transcript_32391/g.78850  ORF Transcript_32391/g.78850 Transcript_32391/m.78850 type:complete len:274 (-) Transcript_32391:263-1084(-)